MSILVSDFTPSPFKVSAELNGTDFAAGDAVQIASRATLYAGGPFTHADVRINARLQARAFTPENPRAEGFVFGSNSDGEDAGTRALADTHAKLDEHGQFDTRIELPQSDIYYGTVQVEAAVRAAVAKLEGMGATVLPVSLPNTDKALPVYYLVATAAWALADFEAAWNQTIAARQAGYRLASNPSTSARPKAKLAI